MARVSVVIPCYNTAQYLADALESVLRQNYSDWEAILVDDGSTDNTRQVAERYESAFGGRLRYIRQQNRGLPAARNTAIANSSGEFLALLDADDVWLEHRLQRSVEMLDAYPRAGLAHGKVARIDLHGEIFEVPPVPKARYLSGHIAEHIYCRRAHLLCPTVTFRRKCLEETGLFDETMRAVEDRDLWFRIARHYAVRYIDEIIAHYRISSSSMSQDWDRMCAAQLKFLNKHYQSGACSRKLRREASGNFYRERGDSLFRQGELRQSLGWYGSAVAANPRSLGNDYMLIRALAEPVLAVLRGTPWHRPAVEAKEVKSS